MMHPRAYALAQLLGALGHEVVTAADGVEAWALLQGRRVQLVLSDWMMPWMDGLELCRRIRGRAGRPYTYFVLFTGRGGREDRLEALAAGADDFLAKPFDMRELVARAGDRPPPDRRAGGTASGRTPRCARWPRPTS